MTDARLRAVEPVLDPSASLYARAPSGWFDLGRSSELPAGGVITRCLAGKDVVLYRTQGGEARAVSPYCPHMGAHLGRGGKVRGDAIVCPFHAFEFGAGGRCTRTGYGTPPPPKLRVASFAVHELHGVMFVWHGAAGEPPSFRLPHRDDAADGFWPMLDRVYEMRGHPQETNENSVDIGHFRHVHGYENVRAVGELRFDGAELHATYEMDRPAIPGWPRLGKIGARFQIHVHGLGYSLVEVTVPSVGLESRHYVFATPTEPGRLRLRAGFALKKGSLALPFGSRSALARLARSLLEALLMQVGIRMFVHDVGQDFEIWKNKRYVHPPQLVDGDGPIAAFRRWARQFYPEAAAPGAMAGATP